MPPVKTAKAVKSAKGAKTAAAPPLLATRETRLPVVVALDLAFKGRTVSVVRLGLWKDELRDLIGHAARKFVGFQNVDSLRKALNIVLGLISLALLEETDGQPDPARWAELIVTRNFMDLVKKAIALAEQIRQDEDGKPYPYLFELDRTGIGTKDLLVAYATAKTKETWIGYDRFRADRDRTEQLKTEDRLLRWLIVRLIGEAPAKITEKHLLLEDALSPVEVINALLLRHISGLGVQDPKAPKKKTILLTQDDFIALRKKHDAAPAAWAKAAQKRYAALLQEIPAPLHPGLGREDWFEAHLKKGPPKITAKTVWTDDLPALSGIYYYDQLG